MYLVLVVHGNSLTGLPGIGNSPSGVLHCSFGSIALLHNFGMIGDKRELFDNNLESLAAQHRRGNRSIQTHDSNSRHRELPLAAGR